MSEFVGRASSVATLRTALTKAREGRAGVALVGGEAGIGKTSLAEEVRRQAHDAGVRTLWASCSPFEAAPPYWPWVQVLRAYARDRDLGALIAGIGAVSEDLSRLVPDLLSNAKRSEAQMLDPDQERFRLFDSFATFLQKASDAQPCLVVLDDLQWADAPSLALLQFAVRELREARILILATYRDDEIVPDGAFARALVELPRDSIRIALEGLSESEVAELLATSTGTAQSEDVVRDVHTRTGGNPFFVSEIAALLAERSPREHRLIPTRVGEVIEDRLRKVSPSTLSVLSAAALAGQSSPAALLTRVTGRSGDEVREAMEEARAARFVHQEKSWAKEFAFNHSIVREVLDARLASADRARLNRAIGEALEEMAGAEPPLARLAYHFLEAGPEGSPEKALDYAARAAREARERLAYEDAAELYERALDVLDGIGGSDERRLEISLGLADARMRAGDWEAAIDAYLAAAALARALRRPDDLARAALGLGAGLGGFEVRLFDQRQIDLLEESLATLPIEDSSLRAWVMARLSVALAFVGSEERRAELAREAVEMARRLGDAAATVYALSTYCDTMATPQYSAQRFAATAEMVDLAQRAGDPELELLARRFRVVSLLEAGDIAALDHEIEAFARLAETLKQPISLWYVPLFRGMRALMEGRFDDAERLARRASELGERAHSENARMLADFTLLPEIYRQAGRFDVLEEQWGRFLAAFPPMAAMMDWWALAMPALGRDNDAKARAELERLAAAGALTGMMGGGMWIVMSSFFSEAAAAVRNERAAGILYDALAPYGSRVIVCGIAGATYGSVHRVLALLADVLERTEAAERHFEDALEAHARIGALPLLAHTQREYADMLQRRGAQADRERAEELLGRAIKTYRRLGMTPYLAQAEELRAGAPAAENAFVREGATWSITFEGRTIRLPEVKGLRDIATLLARPGKEVHVSDLIAASEGVASDVRAKPDRKMSKARLAETGLETRSDGGLETIDATARAAYKSRLTELQEELDEADRFGDAGRASKAKAELDFIAGELAAAYGLGGRARISGDPAERARKAVTQRIRNSISRITKEHAGLGRHLDRSIRTGSFCAYEPETPTVWAL
jgi:tetratricopeptide (TPR) repeat protein